MQEILLHRAPEQNNLPPPPLNEHYYKSRQSLALFSGLLFSWEFLGITVSPDKEILNTPLTITNNNAIPIVLFVLVVYFIIRTIIEWKQSEIERRKMRISRIDFTISMSIPALAISTFLATQFININVGGVVSYDFALIFFMLCMIILGIYGGFFIRVTYYTISFIIETKVLRSFKFNYLLNKLRFQLFNFIYLVLFTILCLSFVISEFTTDRSFLTSVGIFSILSLLITAFLKYLINESRFDKSYYYKQFIKSLENKKK